MKAAVPQATPLRARDFERATPRQVRAIDLGLRAIRDAVQALFTLVAVDHQHDLKLGASTRDLIRELCVALELASVPRPMREAEEPAAAPPSRDGVGSVEVTPQAPKAPVDRSAIIAREPWRVPAGWHGRAFGVRTQMEDALAGLRELESELDRAWQAAANAPQSSAAPEPATAAATTTEPWRPLAAMHGKAHRVLAEVERSLVELRELESELDRAWQAAANVPQSSAAPEPAAAPPCNCTPAPIKGNSFLAQAGQRHEDHCALYRHVRTRLREPDPMPAAEPPAAAPPATTTKDPRCICDGGYDPACPVVREVDAKLRAEEAARPPEPFHMASVNTGPDGEVSSVTVLTSRSGGTVTLQTFVPSEAKPVAKAGA